MRPSLIRTVLRETVTLFIAAAAFAAASASVRAATYTYVFNNTTLGANVGPVNPANGPVAFYGTNLNAGDILAFDGIVIDPNPSANGDWAAVSFNGNGTGGVTGATLGVLLRDGTANGDYCQLWTNAVGIGNIGTSPTPATNRCVVQLTCTQTGSTTNMSYLVEVDQGLTGTFSIVESGTGLNFANNAVGLAFGSRNQPQTFIQNQPIIAVSAPTPTNNIVPPGSTATFAASLTAGWPNNTTEQWLSNGVPILGATSLTYTTPPVTTGYNGAHYSIIVSNQLNPANVVTSSVAVLTVRSGPGIIPFNFPTTTVTAGGGSVTDPGISINGAGLLAGDQVVFDAIIIPNGAQNSDAWTAINIAGGGYGNVTSAQLGLLCRMGSGANPSQLFINGAGYPTNPTPGSAQTNRIRIVLYPSINGSTTNMGWSVAIDQNLTGTFLPALSGTNLTFPNNTLPLTFGSSGSSSIVYQDPQTPVSIFSGPNPPLQVVAQGAPATIGVTVSGWYPAFQWYKNGALISGATNENYTLASASLADNGDQFVVVVTNRVNGGNVVTSSVAKVSVLIPNNLSWYPTNDFTTWDTVTPNWTTNAADNNITFASGNNVTFDSLGYNIGGEDITVTNTVNPNSVTVNVSGYDQYVLSGAGNVSAQSLLLTGDGTGSLILQTPASDSFANMDLENGSTLQVGYLGVDSAFQASQITNNGVINFDDAGGTLQVSAVITGSGVINQNGTGTTVLSATNSTCTIGTVSAGVLSIASTPNPGPIVNNAEIDPASAASVLVIPNPVSGSGYYNFNGFQTTVLTGQSSFTGRNLVFWSDVVVNNPQALGDANNGDTVVSGADRFGGLYLSNNIVWTQPLELDTRYITGVAATAPHISNLSGTNDIVSPLTFIIGTAAGISGSELNVEATTGQLTIDAGSALNNEAVVSPVDLNLQGSGTGFWNAVLSDSIVPLNVLKRGSGSWTLGGANTYSGTTTVSNGTLLVTSLLGTNLLSVLSGATLGANGATIAGPVTIASGGTFAPGLPGANAGGTATIDNSLTLASGSVTSVVINKTAGTNDKVTGLTALTYGGTLVISNISGTLTASDTFPLFSSATYSGMFTALSPATPGNGLVWDTSTLATDGTLRISTGSVINPNPTNITATVVGGSLQLTWPSDHTGWTLQAQTNSLSVGLSNNWVNIPASTATNKFVVPLIPGNGAIFYRLVLP
jgi:autotransporter-associated beta strand protein